MKNTLVLILDIIRLAISVYLIVFVFIGSYPWYTILLFVVLGLSGIRSSVKELRSLRRER